MRAPIQNVQLSEDVFLFSCRQALVARTRGDGIFQSHKRFEPFLLNKFQRPQSPSVDDFRDLVTAILAHHRSAWPELRDGVELNLQSLAHLTHAFAVVIADVRELSQRFVGYGVPHIPATEVEYSNQYPEFQNLLSGYSALLRQQEQGEEVDLGSHLPTSANVRMQFAAEWWDIVASQIHGHLSAHAEALLTFLVWEFAAPVVSEPPDFRVRPPVGDEFHRFMRQQMGFRSDDSRGGRSSGPRRGSQGSSRGRDDGHSFAGRSSSRRSPSPVAASEGAVVENSSAQTPSQGNNSRSVSLAHGSSFSSHERVGAQARTGRGGGSQRGHRNEGRGGGATTDAVQAAASLKQVEEAIETLKSSRELHEVALHPVNSYLRHMQHERIVELGFGSESRGEGKDRAVVILRKGEA